MPKFSIIVPIYKIEAYIEECIKSVLAQTFTDFELILVDDGSPDGSPQICDNYANNDSRIKVIHKENAGVLKARKTGVDTACGEYVVFVDGDDFIEQTYLAEFNEVIIKHNPDVVCCGYYDYLEGEKTERHIMPPYGLLDRESIEKEIFPILIESERGIMYPPSLWAKAFRRELYKKGQLEDGAVNIGEDNACAKACMFYANSMFVIDKCLYDYRQNPTSITKKPKPFLWEGPEIIGKHFEDKIDTTVGDLKQQIYRNIVHNLFNVAVSQFNKNEPFKQIKQDIISNITNPYYQNAIKGCVYKKNLKGVLAKWALKRKKIRVMRLYNKIK